MVDIGTLRRFGTGFRDHALARRNAFRAGIADPIAWYDTNAEARYERVAPERLHGWMADLLPAPPAAALDVGAGTGRDAAWLSSRGYKVVAVATMRRSA